jgi:DNA-binding LytR/AlgR family response regulator
VNTAPRALVAEDEAPQRDALVRLLGESWPELRIDPVCEDGLSALEAMRADPPALALLDIRMPGVSGLEVARAAPRTTCVVFTTAYDEYAVQAFDAGAIDYLLKPLRPERVREALDRVRRRLADGATPDLAAVIAALEAQRARASAGARLRWITASAGDTVRVIGIDEVLFFQARDKYTRVVAAAGEAVIRTPLRELLEGLDPAQFWQVHRGVVVRVAAVDRAQRDELGRWSLSLRGHAERLPVSAAFQGRFRGM